MAHSASESERSRSPRPKKDYPPATTSCLYIGNIDKRLTEDQLREAFEANGELDYCFIVYEPHSGSGNRGDPKQSRGYGFAKYRNQDDAQRAKEKMNGADLNGRRITVEVSKRTNPREPTPGRYLGKKRTSPVRKSNYRRSYSRSYSRSSSRSPKHHRHRHEKRRHRHYRSRSRSSSYRRHKERRQYSRSPRR